MIRKRFEITWYEKKRYGEPFIRNSIIEVFVKEDQDTIGFSCQKAVDAFVNNYGSLKKNEIVEIWELDEDGNTVGEVIKPISDSVVPLEIKKAK